MLIWILATFILQLLMTTLAGALRHLNFSELQNMFKPEEYKALVKQLEKRDEVEIISWLLATLCAIFCASGIAIEANQDLIFLVFLAVFLSTLIHVIPLIAIAPWAERFLIELMPLYQLIESFPLAVPLVTFVKRLGYRLAGEKEDELLSIEMTHLITEGMAEGIVGSSEKAMIQRMIDFKTVLVRDIMTPRARLVFLQDHSNVRQALTLASEHGLSRLPIYDSEKDQIKGVFFIRDALKEIASGESIESLSIEKMMRQVPVVPETRSVASLLNSISKSRNQMLIVLNEYGGLAGVVTLEDILEEIVGEIRDEYAEEEAPFREVEAGAWEVQGSTSVEDLIEELHLKIPEDSSYETVAGFVLSQTQRIPKKGETFIVNGYRFEVLEASPRRVERIRIEEQEKS